MPHQFSTFKNLNVLRQRVSQYFRIFAPLPLIILFLLAPILPGHSKSQLGETQLGETQTASAPQKIENNLFSLDLAANTLIVKGKRVKFDAALIELHKNDIFVDVRQLAKWFPIDIEYNASNLMVILTSREPFLSRSKPNASSAVRRRAASKNDKSETPKLLAKIFPGNGLVGRSLTFIPNFPIATMHRAPQTNVPIQRSLQRRYC